MVNGICFHALLDGAAQTLLSEEMANALQVPFFPLIKDDTAILFVADCE